jgi:uncharacterized membrane protein YeaQ/YmgE (transglycosylase-associated protein family)
MPFEVWVGALIGWMSCLMLRRDGRHHALVCVTGGVLGAAFAAYFFVTPGLPAGIRTLVALAGSVLLLVAMHVVLPVEEKQKRRP